MTKSLVFNNVRVLVNHNILALDVKNINEVWPETYNTHLDEEKKVIDLISRVSGIKVDELKSDQSVHERGMSVYIVKEHVDAPEGIPYEEYQSTFMQGVFEGEDGLAWYQPEAGNISAMMGKYPEPVLIDGYNRNTAYRVIIFERYFEGDKKKAMREYGKTLIDHFGEYFTIASWDAKELERVQREIHEIYEGYYPKDGSNDHIDFGNKLYNEVREVSQEFEEHIFRIYGRHYTVA